MSHNSHNSHSNHASHGNHLNYSDVDLSEVHPDTGVPKTLTWSNWGTIDNDEYISQSVNKIKELRDKIQYLKDNHGGGSWSGGISNGTINLSSVPNTEFDGVGADYVEDVHYDNLKDSLDTMRDGLGLGMTGLPIVDEGDLVNNKHFFADLKSEIDSLAATDLTAQYNNHNNHDNHNNHGNHASYRN